MKEFDRGILCQDMKRNHNTFTTSGAVDNERLSHSAVLTERSARHGASTGHAMFFIITDRRGQ
jgi:hypothetical protein